MATAEPDIRQPITKIAFEKPKKATNAPANRGPITLPILSSVLSKPKIAVRPCSGISVSAISIMKFICGAFMKACATPIRKIINMTAKTVWS